MVYFHDEKDDRWIYVTKNNAGGWTTAHFKGFRLYSFTEHASRGEAVAAAEAIKQRFYGPKPRAARKSAVKRTKVRPRPTKGEPNIFNELGKLF